MAAFHAARPMEDFFINPTFNLDAPLRPATMVDNNQLYTAAAAHNDVYMIKSRGKAPLRPSASIVDLVNEPVFWHAYTSDEEVASPVDEDDNDADDDDFSLHSDESSVSIASSISFPEQLAAEACADVQQQCNRAQAVKIQAAGRARVVSLPKPITIPARRSIVRPASPGTPSKRPSLPRLRSTDAVESTRSSEDSHNTRNDSISSSSVNSPASTAPSSVDEHESMDRRPQIKHQQSFSRHVPLMEAAKAFSPNSSVPNSPMFTQAGGFPKRQSTAMSDRSETASISNRSSIRRMTKFSSGFGLNKIGKNLSGRDSIHGSELESVKEPEQNYIAPTRVPARTTSMKPKMVARAANERAPPITLPPFPDEEPSNEWPSRRDSGAPSSRPRSFSTKKPTHVARIS